ncbi:ABC transporter ATP-binding protein [Pontibacter rugosus]
MLHNISFKQQEFQNIAIAGETGSGKSTLLKVIAGLAQPDTGHVFFEGELVEGPAEKLVPGHAGIAYLSQHFELPKSLRVEQVLKYANTLDADEAETLHEVCRISHLLKRRTDQLSGGEKQRVAVARLLSTSPKLFLLDEPFSNLDPVHKNILKSVIQDIGEKLQITCIMVSHDPLDSLPWADAILVIKDGSLLQQGAPEQIYRQPVNEYAAALFGKYNLISTALAAKLTGAPVKAAEGKQALIRPESLKIAAATKIKPNAGRVQKVSFHGSYYQIEIMFPEGTLMVTAGRSEVKAGDMLSVLLSPDEVWYV